MVKKLGDNAFDRQKIVPSEAKVKPLIDPITKWWNVALIKQIFIPEEASIISRIPLCGKSLIEVEMLALLKATQLAVEMGIYKGKSFGGTI